MVNTKPFEDALFRKVRDLLLSSRKAVVQGVNSLQVLTNFEIGRYIFEHEQQGESRANYGKELIKNLSEQLTSEFGRGFSKSNLEYMRRFFLAYRDRLPIAQSDIGQFTGNTLSPRFISSTAADSPEDFSPSPQFRLSWTHYIFLMGIKNPEERSFYEIESADQDWTLPELRRQFDSGLYERLALSRDKEGILRLAKEGQVVARPDDLLKEPFVLEFLGLSEQARYSESDLEAAIISRLEQFLLELGKGFLFESRQKRITLDEEHFFVDLVFYNRLLRCYVLIDLKIGKMTHQDLGQMQMYVNFFDRFLKLEGENPTVGIVLCKKKNESLVEITLPEKSNIHAREYMLYLPGKEELQRKLNEWTASAALQCSETDE